MDKSWLFKYRIEFPIFICVLTTFVYTFDTSIFLYYRPTLSLLISVLIASIGVGIHLWLSSVPDIEDINLNSYIIHKHTIQIGDYFLWLAVAFFSGSILAILIYSIAYIIFYGVKIKRSTVNLRKYTKRKIFSRDLSNVILMMLSIVYISALKNYLITKSFTPLLYVKILFGLSILAFIVAIATSPNKTIENISSDDCPADGDEIEERDVADVSDGVSEDVFADVVDDENQMDLN